jgi:hypothetical protein
MSRPSKTEKPPVPSGSTALILSGSSASPLSAGQNRFNRLLKEIDRLRKRIESTRTELEDLTRFALTEVLPLELERARASGDLARALYQVLKAMRADPKLRRRVPRGIEDCIIELVQQGLRTDLRDPHPDLPKIHKELTGATIESRRKVEFSFMRGQMEAEFRAQGIDVDLWGFDVNLPPDKAAEQLARLVAEARERKQQRAAADTGADAASGTRQRPTPNGDAREEITLLYRHLAKLLHPDLEQDPARRAEKEAAMKEVTLAYKANDLLTLLRVEVEWVRGDATRVAGMDEERLARCNAMLSAQVKELKQELKVLPSDPKYGPASVLAHPVFGFEMFDRKVPLKALRAEIDQRLQWAREITEGRNPEQVLAEVFALDSFAELLDSEIDELILKEMESAPPRRRRKR